MKLLQTRSGLSGEDELKRRVILDEIAQEISGEQLTSDEKRKLIHDFRKRQNPRGDIYSCASCGMRDCSRGYSKKQLKDLSVFYGCRGSVLIFL